MIGTGHWPYCTVRWGADQHRSLKKMVGQPYIFFSVREKCAFKKQISNCQSGKSAHLKSKFLTAVRSLYIKILHWLNHTNKEAFTEWKLVSDAARSAAGPEDFADLERRLVKFNIFTHISHWLFLLNRMYFPCPCFLDDPPYLRVYSSSRFFFFRLQANSLHF